MRELDPDGDPWDWAAVELRRLRTAQGGTLKDVADMIDRDVSLISKVESGQAHLQFGHAVKIDKAWRTGGHLARIVHLAQSRHDGEWGVETIRRERECDRLSVWSLAWVPALVQTSDYAQAVFRGCGVSNVDQEVEKRIKRQTVLETARARFLVAQTALEDEIAGPQVQRVQLARLLELSERHPVRVVPRTAGAHPGKDGSFTIFGKTGRDTAVWSETLGPGRLVTDGTECGRYRVWFEQVGDRALPLDASASLIRQVMEGLSS